MKIPVEKISPNPQQPRKHFDQEYIEGLAKSLKTEGQKQDITVEDNGDGTYTLVDGECRLRAHKIAGLNTIKASVRPPTNHAGKQRLIDSMIANVSRDNMNAVDEGQGYKAMRGMGMSVREISMTVGKNESHVRSRMLITEQDQAIQDLIAEGRFPHQPEALNALSSIPVPDERIRMARKLAIRGATVRIVVKTCERFIEARKQERKVRLKHPALEVSELTEKPDDWDALYQVGKVPQWQKFTEAVMDTCDNCSVRSMASPTICGACPVVDMCRRLMEKTK